MDYTVYSIYLVAFLLILYTVVRSIFLYKLRINFLNYLLYCTLVASNEFNKALSISSCMECIYSYQKMFYCFWRWNIHGMVQNTKQWNEILFYGNYKCKNSKYKPFKLKI